MSHHPLIIMRNMPTFSTVQEVGFHSTIWDLGMANPQPNTDIQIINDDVYTCDYCGVTQRVREVFVCMACGAPL